jgi:hypothetical protein
MPKSDSKVGSRARAGRSGPFTMEQNHLVERSLPEWHQFALVDNADAAGRGNHTDLTAWKKTEAARLMGEPEFKVLPKGVSYLLLSYRHRTLTHCSVE